MDGSISMLGDCKPLNPSFVDEEYNSDFFRDNVIKGQELIKNSEKEEIQVKSFNDLPLELDGVGGNKSNAPVSLAERRAVTAGFSIAKLSVPHITATAVDISSSEIQSPYLTIPPGLSPTSLLESPVFLSNSMAQTSPTTGKFPFLPNSNADSVGMPDDNRTDDHPFDDVPEIFTFKPPLETKSLYFWSTEKKDPPIFNHQQSLSSAGVSVKSEEFVHTGQESNMFNHNEQKFRLQDVAIDTKLNPKMPDPFVGNDHSSPPDDLQAGEDGPKGEYSSVAVGALAEDGYSWRKYGQKQVKHSEYPRSYYKCTHPNCQVKKKVERSHEGLITEIIYKGMHNHPKPPLNRRAGIPSYPFNDTQIDGSENPGSQAGVDAKSFWANTQNGVVQDWRSDGLESLTPVPAELCESSASMQIQDGARYESPDAVDVSSTLSDDEDEDDRATHGSMSLGGDAEGDEMESKRRKLDSCAIDMSVAASRAVREPRVVIQTTSEVDILDDGYRWRKYGQKVVKGNPNPRSYYKCTNPGCSVRKHVERASHDLKSVITTYEGKHNHEVPAARNSSHPTSGGGSGTTAMAGSQSHSSLHRRPEPPQDALTRLGGAAAALGTFTLPQRDQLGPANGFSFGMGHPAGLPNLPVARLGPVDALKFPILTPPMYTTYLGHCPAAIEAGFVLQKRAQKEEPVPESGLGMQNGSLSVYQQMMSRLPLGPPM